MTNRAVWTIWCDHAEGCGAWIGQEDSRADAERIALAHGWVKTTRGRHYCPIHNPRALFNVLAQANR